MENYEFDDKQNHLFSLLHVRMRFVGGVFIFVGILAGISLILEKAGIIQFSARYNVLGTIISVFLIITGYLLWKAADAFKKIIFTQGHDIEILMNAIKDLYLAYEIQMWIILVATFFVVIASLFLRDFSIFF